MAKSKTPRKTKPDPDAPPRAVIYARLSKAKKTDEATDISLDSQRETCERAIRALGGSIIAVESDVISGDRLDRPGLWAAIERIASGEANRLVVHSLDRLSRDTVQLGVIVHEVRRAGGSLVSATENLESGPLGDLLRTVYSVASAIELARHRERANRSLDKNYRQTGIYRAAERAPYGYRKLGHGKSATFEINPIEAGVVERIYSERAAGRSIRHIHMGLNRDGIPTPMGRGKWGETTVSTILNREVYSLGRHEVWRTRVVRDAEGVTSVEPRPVDERYTVAFDQFVDRDLAERARTVGARNKWITARADRNPEIGIGRNGFFRCGTCGRALSVNSRKIGNPRYACMCHRKDRKPCPSAPSISVDLLDPHVWNFVRDVIEDPRRAAAWRVVEEPEPVDPLKVEALAQAEGRVAALEAQMSGQLDNLALLSGTAKARAAEKVNALNEQIDAAIAERDRLGRETASGTKSGVSTLDAVDVIAKTSKFAIHAMREAEGWEPGPISEEITFGMTACEIVDECLVLKSEDGAHPVRVPMTWRAKQAALSAFNLSVDLYQEHSGHPRWIVTMTLPGGIRVEGEPRTGQKFPLPVYMCHTHPCWG